MNIVGRCLWAFIYGAAALIYAAVPVAIAAIAFIACLTAGIGLMAVTILAIAGVQ